MIRVLGRATSGNVQKVIFVLEELGLKYGREDYGRQFNNTNTDAYRKMNPTMKVPTLVDGDTVTWESNTILRYLAALHGPQLAGATPSEKTHVERWMDWMLAALNAPYLAVFKDAKKPAAERGADFAAQSADLSAQLKILDGHIAGKTWFALDRLTLADIALAPVVKRCLEFPIERPQLPELDRWMKAIESRPAFAVATGARPSTLASAA
jgi:glutathione S-transferase